MGKILRIQKTSEIKMAKILLIDDDKSFRQMIKIALEQVGHEVLEAENGQIGYELFLQQPCDLIITDIFMPEKEGIHTIFDFYTEFPEVKIIALSGGGIMAKKIDFDDDDLVQIINSGMSSDDILELAGFFGAHKVMSKPLVIKDFLQLVDETMTTSPNDKAS